MDLITRFVLQITNVTVMQLFFKCVLTFNIFSRHYVIGHLNDRTFSSYSLKHCRLRKLSLIIRQMASHKYYALSISLRVINFEFNFNVPSVFERVPCPILCPVMPLAASHVLGDAFIDCNPSLLILFFSYYLYIKRTLNYQIRQNNTKLKSLDVYYYHVIYNYVLNLYCQYCYLYCTS
jgi:hypothetical protein